MEEVVENILQWAYIKKETKRQTIEERGGIHRIELKFEVEAKLVTVMRQLEALELNQGIQRPTPNTLESLKYSQAVGGSVESPNWEITWTVYRLVILLVCAFRLRCETPATSRGV